MAKCNVIPVGGRIKAASVGLSHLYNPRNVAELDRAIADLRRKPFEELRRAFFPLIGPELKMRLDGTGLYRPVLKTDQGMGGNFLPFTISDQATSDLSVRNIEHEEGLAFPEAWYLASEDAVREIQRRFLGLDLRGTYEVLEPHLVRRRAEKGRTPFFFARPAMPDRPVVFGADVVHRVERAVTETLEHYEDLARAFEEHTRGSSSQSNVIYFQPDVFVLADGTVAVERINCPDVGFFLVDLEFRGSVILPRIQEIVQGLREVVCRAIVERVGKRVVLVTRDEVFESREDLLEIGEIESLRHGLEACGASVEALPVSQVGMLRSGTSVVLLNLKWQPPELDSLLDRHRRGELECFPNPYFQRMSQIWTGLPQRKVGDEYREDFLRLAGSAPLESEGVIDVVNRLDKLLTRSGFEDDVLYVQLAQETVPVFRRALHSWRQLAKRARREENAKGPIRMYSLPVKPANLLITSSTGPRLHVFRFMCTSPTSP